MSIRYKLLILLLFISLVPLLGIGLAVRQDLTNMGEDLAARSKNVLIHKASTGLTRIVKDHARVLGRERQLLESTTLFLASKIEGVLYGHSHLDGAPPFTPSDEQIGDAAGEYYTLRMGRTGNLAVDFRNITVYPAGSRTDLHDKLLPLLGQVKFDLPQLALWVEVTFPGGTEIVYPGAQAAARMDMPMRMNMGMRPMPETNKALSGALRWSSPQIDPRTGRSAFRISAPIRDIHGKTEGEVSVVVPVDSLLSEEHQASMFSRKTEAFLVKADTTKGQYGRIRIVAREQSGQTMGRHWELPQADAWLDSTVPEQYALAVNALRNRQPTTIGMPYDGMDALWAFAPIDADGTTLMLIVPRSDVVGEAVAAKDYVLAQVERHNAKMGYFALGVIASVLVLALLLSRLFTRNISALACAVRSVAKGDFSARASVRGKDEIGQLGVAFNGMVPELQERVALKSSLEVAQQVQQGLLPGAAPDFPGADISAASEYCDETGGDYYDFIPRVAGDGESLVVAVGDVSGHGIPAALMMSSARAYLHCQTGSRQPLDRVAHAVNGLLHADMDMSGRFMTLFLLELTKDGPIRWVRAGHDPALLYDPVQDRFEELAGEGLPLGVVEDASLELHEAGSPPPGSVIAVGTDGIWERRSPDGTMFGKERMQAVIRAHAARPAADIIQALLQEVKEFGGDTEQSDDITIAIVKTF